MAVASRGTSSSTLNPNAPLFIPQAYEQVEDFSPEWWSLVQSSPWFRDYWIRERFDSADDTDLLADLVFDEADEEVDEFSDLEMALFPSTALDQEPLEPTMDADDVNEPEKEKKEVMLLKSLAGNGAKPKFEKRIEKPAQIVNVKTSPRRIQQPR